MKYRNTIKLRINKLTPQKQTKDIFLIFIFLFIGGLGDGDCASLDGPSEEDLGWGLVMLGSERGHSRLDKQGLIIGGQVKLDVRDGAEVTEGHHLKTILTSHSQEDFL